MIDTSGLAAGGRLAPARARGTNFAMPAPTAPDIKLPPKGKLKTPFPQTVKKGAPPNPESIVVVAPVPIELAKHWPAELVEKNGEPHFTLLHMKGPLTEEQRLKIAAIVGRVAKKAFAFPIELAKGVDWFTTDNPDEAAAPEIAHKAVAERTAKAMTQLHQELVAQLRAEGFEPSTRKTFKAHSTLGYLPTRKYDGPVPEGRWVADRIELWADNGAKRLPFALSTATLKMLAAVHAHQQAVAASLTKNVQDAAELATRRLMSTQKAVGPAWPFDPAGEFSDVRARADWLTAWYPDGTLDPFGVLPPMHTLAPLEKAGGLLTGELQGDDDLDTEPTDPMREWARVGPFHAGDPAPGFPPLPEAGKSFLEIEPGVGFEMPPDGEGQRARRLLEDGGVPPGADKPVEGDRVLAQKSLDGDETAYRIEVPVLKFDAEQRLVTGIVLEPNEVDAQGDTISPDVIEKAAHDFLAEYNRRNRMGVQHSMFGDVGVDLAASWVTHEDTSINGEAVKKGSWLMTVKVLSDSIWQRIKKNEITGFSIGAIATVPGRRPALAA